VSNFPAVNTSPLIFLSKGGYLDLLKILGEAIIVPQAVAEEIQTYGEDDVTYQQLNSNNWLKIQKNRKCSYNYSKLGSR